MFAPILVLFVAGTLHANTGAIQIRIEPGVIISVDGVRAGTSTAAELGLRVDPVAPGVHDLGLEVAGGGSMTTQVEVEAGRTTIVRISSVTLRAATGRRKAALEITVDPARPPCRAILAQRDAAFSTSSTIVDDVPSGAQKVRVACAGGQTAESTIEVIPGRTVTVRTDFARKTLVVTGDRPRVKALAVPDSSDRIVNAPISGNAKRALAGALLSGIEVLTISALNANEVNATFRAPSHNAAARLVERLKESSEVHSIEVGKFAAESGGVVIQIHLVFVK
jgi:hypothetical protein